MLDKLPELERIIKLQPSGFITDIDGTITPTSADPLHVTVPEQNLHYLSKLVNKLSLVAVLSGRATQEITGLIHIPGVKYVGHYGLEWSEGDSIVLHPEARPFLSAMRALAADIVSLRNVDGIIIQDKYATISLHYRLSSQPEKTKEMILDRLRKSPYIDGLRIIEESYVVGVVPPVDYDKGDAVKRLIQHNNLKAAIFMGDDNADVPGFRSIRSANANSDFGGIAILVTGKNTPSEIIKEADYTLDGVNETTELLKWLVVNLQPTLSS